LPKAISAGVEVKIKFKEAVRGDGLFFYALSGLGVSGDGVAAQLPPPYGRTDQTQFST
jgi:hypothetical protein